MKFSVCIDIMWPQEEFLEGMETVRAAGLSAYEFWNWQGKDLDAIFRRQQELGLTPAAFCTKEWNLVDPEQRGTFLEGLKESLAAAGRLGCKTLISQVGSAMPGVSRERQTESIIQGLKAAAEFADIAVVSSANYEAVRQEWELYGLAQHVNVLLAQDAGTKEHCIAELMKHGYRKDHTLMVGDAPGDLDAARGNGVYFYPILVRHEDESWKEFGEKVLRCFFDGAYAAYEAQKLGQFKNNLTQGEA